MAVPVVETTSSVEVTTASTSVTVTKPTGTADGDYLVAFVAADRGSSGYPTAAPSGWTQIAQDASGAGSTHAACTAYAKTAGASEPADYTWTLPSAYLAVATMHRVSGVDTDAAINASATATDSNTQNHDSASVTTDTADCLVLRAAAFDGGSALIVTVPSGETELANPASTAATAGNQLSVSSSSRATAGSTGTGQFTSDKVAGDHWASVTLAIKPTAGGGASIVPLLEDRQLSGGVQ